MVRRFHLDMADVRGTDWTEDEVDACVQAYFDHFTMELSGQKFNKTDLYRQLSNKSGRTPSSVEFKFQNISAVLEAIGLDWMKGLAPARNYQELLAAKVSKHIQRVDSVSFAPSKDLDGAGLADPASFFLEAPPELRQAGETLPDYISALVRKFDPVERDMKNRALGEAGEKFVLEHEKRFLTLTGRKDLADDVRWVSKVEGDGAGYDILSFTDRGDQKFVEVKTTLGGSRTPFFISRNEYSFCERNQQNYNLVRLYSFRKDVRGFELRGRIEDHVKLSTETFRAEFQ